MSLSTKQQHIIGFIIIMVVFSMFFIGTAISSSFVVALIVWGSAFVIASLLALGIKFILKEK